MYRVKKYWSIIMGTAVFGLVPVGIQQLVKSDRTQEETNAKSNVAPMVLFITVIALILMLAFSMEIKTFLTQLFS